RTIWASFRLPRQSVFRRFWAGSASFCWHVPACGGGVAPRRIGKAVRAVPETWATLQRLAIDDAHPAWFAPLDELLLARARASSPVRRLLARTLAEGPAPLLFGTIAPALPSVVVRQGWWQLPAEALRRIALLLGAIAFAPAI